MPYLTQLKLIVFGYTNPFPSIGRLCPHLTSLALDMGYQRQDFSGWLEDDLPRQERSYQWWIDLFKGLSKLKKLQVWSLNLPQLVLQSIALSCPNLEYFSACFNSLLSVQGILFVLQHCRALKELHLWQSYGVNLFGRVGGGGGDDTSKNSSGSGDNQQQESQYGLWKAPLERLSLSQWIWE
ncbi:hypothetical protein EDD21DRAFT_355329 [Dissophora ornata]|nr:hypothetical protein EDD21DRAFT_355329 [Dissophora ornata]